MLWLLCLPLQAQETDPDKIDSLQGLQVAIRHQWQRVVTDHHDRYKKAVGKLTPAQDAVAAQQGAMLPLSRFRTQQRRRIHQLDQYLAWKSMPAYIDKVLPKLEETRRHLSSDPNADPLKRDFVRFLGERIRTLRDLKPVLARELPKYKAPTFVPRGKTPEQYRAELLADLGKIEPRYFAARKEFDKRVTELQRLLRAADSAQNGLRRAVQHYYRLLVLLETRFPTTFLREIKVYATRDPRGKPYYHASWQDSAALTLANGKIARLIKDLPLIQRKVEDLHKLYLNAEAKFIEVARKWQDSNGEYVSLLHWQYALNGLLEFIDVGIGAVRGGGTPAGLLFEAGYRLIDWGVSDVRASEPQLSASLLAYRRRMSAAFTPTASGPAPAAPRMVDTLRGQAEDSLRRAKVNADASAWIAEHIKGAQRGAVIKGAAGTVFGGLAEELAEASIKRAISRGGDSMGVLFYAAMLHGEITWSKYRQYPDLRYKQFSKFDRLIKAGRPDRGTGFMKKLKDADSYKKLGKNFLIGAVVTAAKELPKGWLRDKRAEKLAELALLDFEWLVRRAELHAAAKLWHRGRKQLRDYEAAIGRLIRDRSQTGRRTLKIHRREQPATTDDLRIELRFSAGLDHLNARIGGANYDGRPKGETSVSFELEGPFAAGDATIEVSGHRAGIGNSGRLDARPGTVARFGFSGGGVPIPDQARKDQEEGPDRNHKLAFLAPTIEILRPKAQGYLPGDWLDVKYKLPGSLAHRALKLLHNPFRTMQVALPRSRSGEIQIQVPVEPGRYDLVLVAPDALAEGWQLVPSWEKLLVAKQAFRVRPIPLREIARTRFFRLEQGPLPDRGPRLAHRRVPIRPGLGRVYFDSRDASAQICGPRVSIRVPGGGEINRAFGGLSADLAPGVYDFLFAYTPPIWVKGHTVRAGQTTTARVDGLGRLVFRAKDALGEVPVPRVSIRAPGSKREITHTGGSGWVDLKPGRYDVLVQTLHGFEQKNIPVEAGKQTLVHFGGLGRILLRSPDALGKEIRQRISIRKAGANEEYARAWGGGFIDVPAGSWDVHFTGYTPVIVMRCEVQKGKETTAKAGGYGRLQIQALNAAGQNSTHRLSIRKAGTEKEITSIFGSGSVDLPPGSFDLVYPAGRETQSVRVSIRRGAVTKIAIRVP